MSLTSSSVLVCFAVLIFIQGLLPTKHGTTLLFRLLPFADQSLNVAILVLKQDKIRNHVVSLYSAIAGKRESPPPLSLLLLVCDPYHTLFPCFKISHQYVASAQYCDKVDTSSYLIPIVLTTGASAFLGFYASSVTKKSPCLLTPFMMCASTLPSSIHLIYVYWLHSQVALSSHFSLTLPSYSSSLCFACSLCSPRTRCCGLGSPSGPACSACCPPPLPRCATLPNWTSKLKRSAGPRTNTA